MKTQTQPNKTDVIPPEVPGYLEPAFHFAVRPSVRAVDFFGVLLPALAAAGVDFSAPALSAERGCKVKCTAYGGGASAGVGRVPFVVALFRLDAAGSRLVAEFQRRSVRPPFTSVSPSLPLPCLIQFNACL
jgi:hypothetical protein